MLDNELEKNLNDAFKLAHKKKHEFVTLEHLFLSLLENKEAIEVLKYCGADLKALQENLESFISKTTPIIQKDEDQEIQPTLGFQRVLQRAVFHVQSSGKKEVDGANLLVAIFSEKEMEARHKQDHLERRLSHYIQRVYHEPCGCTKDSFCVSQRQYSTAS